jgi:replicative DNA helicase
VKRNLGLAFARNVAKSGTPVLYASTQLTEYGVAERLVAAEGRVSLEQLADGHPDEVEWPQLGGAISRLGNTPLQLAELSRWDVRELENLVVAARGQSERCLVIIDGFDALVGKGIPTVTIPQVVTDLRRVAKWLNVPVLALTKPLRAPSREWSPDLMQTWIKMADAVLIMEKREHLRSKNHTVVLNVLSKHHGGPGSMDVPLAF